MVNKNAHLNPKIFDQDIEQIPTREGYGEGLVLAGERDERVVVLCADLTESTRSILFKEKFPDRFIEVGVAEQMMATVAAGMANYGKIPFISSYAAFSPGRNWEQIRTTIAINDVPVKIAGAHAGISVGPDGATHQQLEDMAIMRAVPNIMVIAPCDSIEAKKATLAAAFNGKPTYLRFTREKTPVFTTEDSPFEIGRAEVLWDGGPSTHDVRSGRLDVCLIACGPLVYQALLAAKELESHKISVRVINSHTLKPLDKKTILQAAKDCGAIVTVEEHQIIGGLGGAVAEVLSENYPVPIKRVGVEDRFGESGEPSELMEKFGLGKEAIIKAVTAVLRMKDK